MEKINLGAMISEVKNHWKTPSEGKYISYGEFTAHNTLRGAAGGGVLLAELLCAEGYIERR